MNICVGLCGLEKHPYKISPGAKPECVGSFGVLFPEGWILAGCCFGAVSLSCSLLGVSLPCRGLPGSARSGQFVGLVVFSLASCLPYITALSNTALNQKADVGAPPSA